jgi:hypothetical protein
MYRKYGDAIRRIYQRVLSDCLVRRAYRLELTPEFFSFLLDILAEEYVKKRVMKAEIGEVLMERFRSFVDVVTEGCTPLLEKKIRENSGFREKIEELGFTVKDLTRMMAYVFLNKLVFYEVLRLSYGLSIIRPDTSSNVKFMEDI